MSGSSPSPSPSPSYSTSGGSFVFGGTSGGSAGSSAVPGKYTSYLGAGDDVAQQYHPSGWAPYITIGGVTRDDKGNYIPLGGNAGGWYSKTAAEQQPWLVDPNSGSFKRLNYYYSQLPSSAKKKWKSAASYWKWAVGLTNGPRTDQNNVWQSPWDVMGEIASMSPELRDSVLAAQGGGNGSGSGAQSLAGTYTTKSVNLTDAKTARRLVNQVYQNLLGRDATDQEAKNYLHGLNATENKNPTVTRTTTDARGRVVNQKQSGGTDATQVGIEHAESNPDYKRFQSETTYYDAFMSALASPVQGA